MAGDIAAAPGAACMPCAAGAFSDRLGRARAAAARVCDPEIPSLTLEDLGILREVSLDRDHVIVTIAPTYTGCPATDMIRDDVSAALDAAGVAPFEIRIALSPAWSSDWITASGRRKLREAGIAPPACVSQAMPDTVAPIRFFPRVPGNGLADASPAPHCPRCDSPRTEPISEYGSTACKSLYRCLACAEPFDYFKPY